jgi:hypothetical protein
MEQELRGWENCDPSPFGEPSYIETHVSTSPPLGLMLLDQIPKVIFLFELGSYLVLLQFILGLIWFYFNLFLVSFGYVF